MSDEFEPTTNTNIHIFYLFLPHPPLLTPHSTPFLPPHPPTPMLTCVLALILICPITVASGPWFRGFSMLRFARASSPNMDRAYMLAAINPQSPRRA